MTFPAHTLAWAVLAGILVLALPGAAWLAWFGDRQSWLENLADAVGLSISLYTLIGLLGFLAGWQFRAIHLEIGYGLCLLALLAGLWRRRPSFRPWGWLAGLAGLAGIAAVVAWRLYQAHTLLLPAWVDSLHHTLIVQLILAHGGVPATLEPVIQAPLGYHYGFHLVTALFAAISGLPAAQSVLWFGQALNGLVALAVYRLAHEIWPDWRRAALAALLVAFASQMPAYYVSWGRYTLAAGLVVMPLAMAALIRAVREPGKVNHMLNLGLLTAGVALTHLTALYLLGLFTAIFLAERAITAWFGRRNEPGIRPLDGLWQAGLVALAGVALTTPWLVRVFQAQGGSFDVGFVSPAAGDQSAYWQYILYLLGPRFNAILLGLAAAGLVVALWRGKSRALAVWGLLIALLTLPWGPRIGPYRPDHMAIILFLPAALLLSAGIFEVVDLCARLARPWLKVGGQAVLLLAALGSVLWGAWSTRDVINRDTVLVQAADLEAMNWLQENTPPDAVFLINTTVWMGTTYRGVDGGYWIPALTGRKTTLPPALYTLGPGATVEQINDWAKTSTALTTCDTGFWNLVDESGASYLYLRQGTGSMQPEGFSACQGVTNIFQRDGVYIYALESSAR